MSIAKKVLTGYVLSCVLVLCVSGASYAVTVMIGDKDGFGFGSASEHENVLGEACDINGNGVLDPGDALPDLNGDGWVATGSGDDFNNREASEYGGNTGVTYTDVALSNSNDSVFGGRDYITDEVYFTFTFTVPAFGDLDYGLDHFVNFVYGDYDVNPMYSIVEGDMVEMEGNSFGGINGFVWRVYHIVEWEDMLDGKVTIEIVAPEEPYVVFDYALLDMDPIEIPATVPEPASVILLCMGLAGLIRKVRK